MMQQQQNCHTQKGGSACGQESPESKIAFLAYFRIFKTADQIV